MGSIASREHGFAEEAEIIDAELTFLFFQASGNPTRPHIAGPILSSGAAITGLIGK